MEKKLKIKKHFSILKKAEDIAIKVLDLIKQEPFLSINASKLKEMTKEFRKRLTKGESFDDIMVEAFAAAYRDVQIVYGINL